MTIEAKDKKYMKVAIEQAKIAFKLKEIPVGAVIVQNDKIVSFGFNERERKKNSLLHAEIVAINSACKKLKSWRLLNSTIYVTLEPCIMCAGAIINSKIKKIVFGTKREQNEHLKFLKFLNKIYIEEKIEIKNGVSEKECKDLLQKFFKKLR